MTQKGVFCRQLKSISSNTALNSSESWYSADNRHWKDVYCTAGSWLVRLTTSPFEVFEKTFRKRDFQFFSKSADTRSNYLLTLTATVLFVGSWVIAQWTTVADVMTINTRATVAWQRRRRTAWHRYHNNVLHHRRKLTLTKWVFISTNELQIRNWRRCYIFARQTLRFRTLGGSSAVFCVKGRHYHRLKIMTSS